MKNIRRFVLNRLEDETGISGSGVVAEGVVFSDGVVAVRWVVPENSPPERHHPTSVVFHDEGLASVEKIHGHGGKTRIEFLDGDPNHWATEAYDAAAEIDPVEALVPRVIKALRSSRCSSAAGFRIRSAGRTARGGGVVPARAGSSSGSRGSSRAWPKCNR